MLPSTHFPIRATKQHYAECNDMGLSAERLKPVSIFSNMTHGSQCLMLRFGKPIHFYPVTYQLTEVLVAEPLAPISPKISATTERIHQSLWPLIVRRLGIALDPTVLRAYPVQSWLGLV